MVKSLILFVFLLKACAFDSSGTKENKTNVKTAFFEDINLFALEGVRKIENSPSSYPYVQTEYVNDTERNIIYHASKEISYRREYKKQNNYWLSSFSSNGDTSTITTYEYVTSNKMIDFIYYSNDNIKEAVLADVLILEGSTETLYDMGNEPNFKPDINAIDLAKKKSKSVFTKEIIIANGILTTHEKRKDRDSKLLHEEVTCYELGNHSYFWWRYFGWTVKKIECQ